MKRFLIFLSVYTAASALSWSLYYQFWQLTRSFDYTITVVMQLLLGPLEDIGLYANILQYPHILELWGKKTAILVVLVALACFRSEHRSRRFWWYASGVFWLLNGFANVMATA